MITGFNAPDDHERVQGKLDYHVKCTYHKNVSDLILDLNLDQVPLTCR